jgi:type II secretion system protein N
VRAGRIVVVVAIFTGVLALTFPTEGLVRWALARALPPGGPRMEFGQASLRPWGIRLAPATLRDADGYRIAAADWLVARPSLLGFVHDRAGRPWRATGAAYGGTFSAVLDVEAADLEWHDVDLARVPTLIVAGDRLAGSAGGAATLRGTPATGGGTLAVRGVSWPTAARLLTGTDTMPVDGSVWWTLAPGQLSLDAIAAHGAGVDAKGSGSVRLAPSLGRSVLDVGLTLVPGPDTAPGLRRLIADLPPPASGGDERRLAITGTIDAPRFEVRP